MEEAGMFLFVMAVGGKLQTNNMTFPNFVLNFSQLRLEILLYSFTVQIGVKLPCVCAGMDCSAAVSCSAAPPHI